MANTIGTNSFDQRNDVDAYLDAFISGAGSVNPELNPKGGQERLNSIHQEVFSARATGPDPQPVNEPQDFRDCSPTRDEIQQLRRFLGEVQAKNQVRQAAPSPSNGRGKRGFKFIKNVALIVGLSFTSLNGYVYYQNCTKAGNCLWNLTLTFPQEKSGQLLQETLPQVPKPLSSDPFREGVKKAMSAVELAKMANNRKQWSVVVEHWLESIHLMNSVPRSHAKFDVAQEKAREYIDYLEYAQAKFTASQSESAALEQGSELACPKPEN
jgi:hypothetical protein